MKKIKKELDNIKCVCGYQNLKHNVQHYGTCTRCGKVLDNSARFKFEMKKKLMLWRKD